MQGCGSTVSKGENPREEAGVSVRGGSQTIFPSSKDHGLHPVDNEETMQIFK